MTSLCLLWLAVLGMWQPAPPLSLSVRVFRGAVEVTRDTTVTVYEAGSRTQGTPVPQAGPHERQLRLPAGRYDLQLMQQQDGKVVGISWTSLRLLVDYPGEFQRHLEVINFQRDWGALQIRQAGPLSDAPVAWSARLTRADGSEVARGVPGDGYQLLVAPTGQYLLQVTRANGSLVTQQVEVRDNLTYLKTFPPG